MRISHQLAGLSLAAVSIIIVVAVCSFLCVNQLTESHQSVYKSASVLESTQKLCFHIAYASAAQRGYIITGKDSLVDLYHSEIESTKQTMNRLLTQAQDNPEERQLVQRIQRTVTERLGSLETTMETFETKGQDAAFDRIKRGAGLALMTKTIQQTDDLADYELKQLIQRRNNSQAQAQTTQGVIVIGSLLAVTIIIICYLVLARTLGGAISSLLRASQNVARERFESLVDIESNNELGDLGRAFNTLAGHLKERTMELEKAKIDLVESGSSLTNKAQDLDSVMNHAAELQIFIEQTAMDIDMAHNYLKVFDQELRDCGSLANLSGTSLRQILDFERDVRVAAENADRRCKDLQDGLGQFSDQADLVCNAVSSLWNGLPETKDLISQLDALDNELSVLNVISSLTETKSENISQQEITIIKERLKSLHQSLAGIRSSLNVNISHMQQTAREALDASGHFTSTLKGTHRPLDSINSDMKQLLQSALSSRGELINLDRLHQRQLNSLDELSKGLNLLDGSLNKDQDFIGRIKIRLSALRTGMPSSRNKENNSNGRDTSAAERDAQTA